VTTKLKDQIVELITPRLKDEGCELAEVCLSQYKNSTTLRLYVYSKQGASLGECARLSTLVGDLIDGTDLLAKGYTLEVSSPGLDRPLKTAMDYRFRVGETVRVEFVEAARKSVEAELVSASDTDLELKTADGTIVLPLADLKQARIVY
jgi:ribosome maturation factor RimP